MELVELNNVNQGNEAGNVPFDDFNQDKQQLFQQQNNAANAASRQQQQHYTNFPPPQLPFQAPQQRFQQLHQQTTSNNNANNKTNSRHLQQPHQARPVSNHRELPVDVPDLKHRELPVDVPDSFVGVAKQAPKYPPPKSNRQVPLANGNSTNSNSSNNHHHHLHHQAQRNSGLRDSIKLKQLEKPKGNFQAGGFPIGSMQPAVNKAFELDEDDIPTANEYPNNNYNNIPVHQQQQHSQAHQQQLQQQQTPIPSIKNEQPKAISRQSTNQQQYIPDLNKLDERLTAKLNGEYFALSQDIELSKLLSIYNSIIQSHNQELKIPNLASSHLPANITNYEVKELLHIVRTTLSNDELTKDAAELLNILAMYQIEGVVSAFDQLTNTFEFEKMSRPNSPQKPKTFNENTVNLQHQQQQQNINSYNNNNNLNANTNGRQQQDARTMGYGNVPMDIENNIMYHNMHPNRQDLDVSDTMSIQTVRIDKNACQALGATIRRDDTTGGILIARLLCGGAAMQSGLLHEGDEILEVNGIRMTDRSTDEVVNLLRDMEGTLDFTIAVRNYPDYNNSEVPPRIIHRKIFVKAFFNYQGTNDSFNPCKELSMNFEIGDILTILDQSDPNWWQATKADSDGEDSLASLIPSVNFIRQRERVLNDPSNLETNDSYSIYEKNSPVSLLFNCGKRRKKSSQAIMPPDEAPLYEEVAIYYPTKFFKRPIILIGPNMIGRNVLLDKLEHDPDRFARAISHTSRPMADNERNGVHFHFVSRSQFEADIKAGKFIEYGEFQKHYYGTSLDAIKEVVNLKKTCVHLANGPAILNFRQGRVGRELKPFFVFVRPHEQMEKLQKIVDSRFSSQADLQRIIDDVKTIENNYLPYFDKVITVTDIEQAYQELLREIKRIETNPQYIPQFWLNPPN